MSPTRERRRRIRTLAGPLSYERMVYECLGCRKSQAPLDRELGVDGGEKMSRGVVRKVAWSVAHRSFADASADLAEMARLEVSPAECARVAQAEGMRLDAIQRAREERLLAPVGPDRPAPEPEIACERLVLGGDATCVTTVAGEEHKSVYCGKAFALDARGRKQAEPGEQGRPFIAHKRHTASAVDMEDFGPRLKALAYRMGMRTATAVAFLGDGAPCLWNWARDNLPKGTLFIQDFWHVKERLANLCRELWIGDEQARAIAAWTAALWEGRLDDILDAMGREHKKRRGAKREKIEKEIRYLETGRHRMDYPKYRAQGWPIGSGSVEADCKHLVKERYNLTGARWKRDRIPHVLALRLAVFNDEWESAWSRN